MHPHMGTLPPDFIPSLSTGKLATPATNPCVRQGRPVSTASSKYAAALRAGLPTPAVLGAVIAPAAFKNRRSRPTTATALYSEWVHVCVPNAAIAGVRSIPNITRTYLLRYLSNVGGGPVAVLVVPQPRAGDFLLGEALPSKHSCGQFLPRFSPAFTFLGWLLSSLVLAVQHPHPRYRTTTIILAPNSR